MLYAYSASYTHHLIAEYFVYIHSVLVGGGTTTTLSDDQNASIALPQSLFADLELVNTMTVGIGFAFYETSALFPLPEGSPSDLNIGSPVIGALWPVRTSLICVILLSSFFT